MYRLGNGFDVHRFAPERDLVLCGVKVPHTLGLLGHSDADVALHALCDAILGACALRDIGYHFPDTDPRFKGADSRLLAFIPQMIENVAADLGLPADCVSVKATTTERLGFTGRGEGIAAQATALLCRK